MMFVNKYQINVNSIVSGTTATTINIPIDLNYQIVDNAELVDRVFVATEVEKSINPILDYEKSRFLPKTSTVTRDVVYSLKFLTGGVINSATTYATISFDDSDILFEKNNFKNSYLYLRFYDSPNALTQHLVTSLTMYSRLNETDYQLNGRPNQAYQIPVKFILSSPLLKPLGFSEGYHLYDYKDEYSFTTPKSLYMRASFMNAKTGKAINLMTEGIPYPIDQLVNKLYTKYDLYRDSTGYYYSADTSYSTNVSYQIIGSNTDLLISLYEIQTT